MTPISLILFLPLILGGCESTATLSADAANAVQMPQYPPGTVLLHASGATERLVSVGLGTDIWENDRGRQYGRTTNFIAPYAFSETGRSSYQQRISFGDPDKIWPLGRGASVRFGVQRIYSDGRTTERIWRCKDRGRADLTYKGKVEEAIRVTCTVYRPTLSNNYRRLAKEYFYSPRLERLLLTKTTNLRNGDKREDWLLAKLDPEQATQANINTLIKRGLNP